MWVSWVTENSPLAMMSASTFPGETEGSWSLSPTRMRRLPGRTALARLFIRGAVHHGDLVHDDGVGRQPGLFVEGEKAPSVLEIQIQQAVDGGGLLPGGLGQPLGRPAGGRAEHRFQAVFPEQVQNAADDGGLARPPALP